MHNLSALSDVLSGYLFSGELMSVTAGTGFIPHVIHIASGEVCIFFFFLFTWIYLCFVFICC